MYSFVSFRQSTSSQNRQLILYHYWCEEYVHGFVRELTLAEQLEKHFWWDKTVAWTRMMIHRDSTSIEKDLHLGRSRSANGVRGSLVRTLPFDPSTCVVNPQGYARSQWEVSNPQHAPPATRLGADTIWFDTIYSLISLRKSSAPLNRQPNILMNNDEQ